MSGQGLPAARRIRRRLRISDSRRLRGRLNVTRRTREQQPGQQDQSEATREQPVLPIGGHSIRLFRASPYAIGSRRTAAGFDRRTRECS